MLALTPSSIETLAGAYIEAAITLLVFGLGVPALVSQLVPERVRSIARKTSAMIYSSMIMTGLSALGVVGLSVLLLLRSSDHGSVLSTEFLLGADHAAILLLILSVGTAGFNSWGLYAGEELTELLSERVVGRFIQKAIRGVEEFPELEDLLQLAELGRYKVRVLDTLGTIFDEMLERKGPGGHWFEKALRAVELAVWDGDSRNFEQAIRMIEKAVMTLQQRKLEAIPEMAMALGTLQRVGVQALAKDYDPVAHSILGIADLLAEGQNGLSSRVTGMVFELGVEAVNTRSHLFAIAALSKLETMCSGERRVNPATSDYLGLIVHFWYSGPTARQRAEDSLRQMSFNPSLAECLRTARQYHASRARFDTADNLEAMIAEIETA